LSELAGLALMAALKLGCPPGFRVLPRFDLRPDGGLPPADMVVVGPDGDDDIRLVVDVVRPDWLFADMLARTETYSAIGASTYWVFEPAEWIGAALTVFSAGADGGFEFGMSTRDVFVAEVPYSVTVDLPALSNGWPQTLEYVERARILRDRS
jgi:hypothetical protein